MKWDKHDTAYYIAIALLFLTLIALVMVGLSGCTVSRGYEAQTRSMVGYGTYSKTIKVSKHACKEKHR